jgi:uncharacterized SAM-binding protein YcdF (DUF218 family)
VYFTASKAMSFVTSPWFWAASFAVFALAISWRSRGVACAFAAVALAIPVLYASPLVAASLQRLAESSARDTSRPDVTYDAAIVLSGGEARLATAAELMRRGRARQVVVAGVIGRGEARHALAAFRAAGVPESAVILEKTSRNTRENAIESARIVAERGFRNLLLVTSASHVDRALGCFHDVGLYPDVFPADHTAARIERQGWLPRRGTAAQSRAAMHELIGRLAYRLMGYTS